MGETITPCKHCGNVPVISDVGGNNPYYEISCKCEKGLIADSSNREETINCRNIINGRKVENG